MRILFCNFEYPPLGGGGGVINHLLARALALRHQVSVLTSGAFGLPRREIQEGVAIYRVPVWFRRQIATANIPSMLMFLLCGARLGKRIVREKGVDIINTHFVLPSGPVGQTVARRTERPHVLSLHGGDLYDPSKRTSPHRHPLLRLWIRRMMRQADAVIGQSSDTLENARKYFYGELEAERIPLGIERPVFAPRRRSDFGLPDRACLMVTVGRLVRRKAIERLYPVLESLADHDTRLVVVGTGPEGPALRRQARERGLEHRVHFLGPLEDADKFSVLQLCDIYVSTSQHEGFGLVFLEAMAAGLPVVCYDHGGQRDFLQDGETGFLVRLNDLVTFRERCRVLIENPELGRRIGVANRARVEAYYIDRCAARYEDVFRRVFERRGLLRSLRPSG